MNKAYQQNDIQTVNRILENLKTGQRFATVSEKIDEKQQILTKVIQLRQVLEQLKNDIESIKQNENYQTIVVLENWEVHFQELKTKLQRQLERLQQQTQNS